MGPLQPSLLARCRSGSNRFFMQFNSFLSHRIGQKPLCVCFYMISVLLCSFFFFFLIGHLLCDSPVAFHRESRGLRLSNTCRIEAIFSALVIVRFICRSSSKLFQRLFYPLQTVVSIRRTECFIPSCETGRNLTPKDAELVMVREGAALGIHGTSPISNLLQHLPCSQIQGQCLGGCSVCSQVIKVDTTFPKIFSSMSSKTPESINLHCCHSRH